MSDADCRRLLASSVCAASAAVRARSTSNLHIGSRMRVSYCTSMGKLLLANLPESEQRDLVAQMKLIKRRPNTITSKKALRDELDEIQAAGFTVDDQELTADLSAIAAPVRNEARDVVAAVNLVAPISLISLEELVDGVSQHPAQVELIVSAGLGERSLKESLPGSADLGPLSAVDPNDPGLSRSLLRGLMLLAALPRDGAYVGNSELARRLDVSPSTAHRYVNTLLVAGLVEQDARTRRYRRAQ